jgi:hypothetical protein
VVVFGISLQVSTPFLSCSGWPLQSAAQTSKVLRVDSKMLVLARVGQYMLCRDARSCIFRTLQAVPAGNAPCSNSTQCARMCLQTVTCSCKDAGDTACACRLSSAAMC